MARKKWFRKTPKHDDPIKNTQDVSGNNDMTEKHNQISIDHNRSLDYHETLYSSDKGDQSQISRDRGECWQRKHWEPSSAIADNVDSLHEQSQKREEKTTVYDVEQKVDSILKRKRPHRKQVKETRTPNKDVPDGYEQVHHNKTGLDYYKKKT